MTLEWGAGRLRNARAGELLRRALSFARRDTNVVVASVVAINLLRAVSSVILTRLLVPEVFGIAGIIASVSFTFALMSDLGFQAFVVRHRDGDSRRFLDTIWTIALARSLLLTCVLATCASPIASLIGKPELAPLIAVSSLTFLLEGTASLTLLTALRRGMILRLSALEVAVMVAQITAATIFAYFWRSYWAVLTALLASTALKSLLSYLAFPDSARRIAFDRGYARELWKFARFVTGSSMITMVLMQGDKLILAGLMPLDRFGLYVLAGNLATAPLAFTSAYASRVLYPRYAQLWRDGGGDLRRKFYAMRKHPSLLYTFAAGGLIGSAPLIVSTLYDHRYADAAVYLQLLAISAFFSLASNAANEALTATGRIRATFQASVVKLIWLSVAIPTGWYLSGSFGIVAAMGSMEPAVVLFKWRQMHRASLLDLRQEAFFIAAGAAGAAVGAIAALLLG
ncbi:MAG: oligosaccharide flippase family protein [Sphingomonas sp.]|uniref:oligosaccharide flippase family protein n=1 Tax=Sphingomonas sp. TaxID=28214 RepID=UPI001B1BE0B4|nr:oligosaccharide flippase family protein [Sphingomonas sp.]MBO9623890.1 oligosaccharide flippase family protein [Sphingomonas sp.]